MLPSHRLSHRDPKHTWIICLGKKLNAVVFPTDKYISHELEAV